MTAVLSRPKGAETPTLRGLDRLVGPDPSFRTFVSLIALATLIPFVLMPIAQRWNAQAQSVLGIAGLLVFLGGPAHVSSTAYLYADREARDFFRSHRLRYFVVPAILVVGSIAVFALFKGHQVAVGLVLGFQIWLLWHYQKQNYGILAILSRVTTGERVSRYEAWAVRLSAVGGILAAIYALRWGEGIRIGSSAPFVARASLVLTAAILVGGAGTFVCVIAALVSQPAVRRLSLRLIFLLVTCVYFLSAYLWRDQYTAFYTYALAHGLQYFVFMGFVATRQTAAGRSEPAVRRPGLPAIIAIVFTLGVVLALTGDARLVIERNVVPLYGLALGLTMAHFVIDAGIWRLRDDFPRRYVGAAMPFMARPPEAHPSANHDRPVASVTRAADV